MFSLRNLIKELDTMFFAEVDLRILGVMRIMFALVLMMNMLMLAPDLLVFFGPEGLVDVAAGKGSVDENAVSIFYLLPQKDWVVQIVFGVLIYSIAAFGIGFVSRFHAFVIFVLYTSFIHRNIMIFDGEDVVFRVFCFFFIFAPSGRFYSLASLRKSKNLMAAQVNKFLDSAWFLRLFQIQMTLIYISTAWEKMKGLEWLNGTAMYYIYRLEEFVRFPVPEILYTDIRAIRFLTWSTISVEVFLPFALWFKETRRLAIFVGGIFHLAIEYQMNLNMFQWVMIIGLMSFVKWGEDTKFLLSMRNAISRFFIKVTFA